MANKTYSLWRLNGYQRGSRSVASFGFGGQESASKPPQAIYKPLAASEKLLRIFYVLRNMKADVININPEILGGTPVFKGTRVPVEILFDHLESGISIDAFLNDYPTVSKEQVVKVLELVGQLFASDKIKQFYEIAS